MLAAVMQIDCSSVGMPTTGAGKEAHCWSSLAQLAPKAQQRPNTGSRSPIEKFLDKDQ